MILVILFFGSVLALLVLAIFKTRRLEAQCRQAIEDRGGTVQKLGGHFDPTRRNNHRLRKVSYVSKDGDLRQAIFEMRWDTVTLLEDKPWHRCVKKPKLDSAKKINLKALAFARELMSLPGTPALSQAVQYMQAHPNEEFVMRENSRESESIVGTTQFAAVLQAVEAYGLDADGGERDLLDLSVGGTPALVRWRVEGESPGRMLVLELAAVAAKS